MYDPGCLDRALEFGDDSDVEEREKMHLTRLFEHFVERISQWQQMWQIAKYKWKKLGFLTSPEYFR